MAAGGINSGLMGGNVWNGVLSGGFSEWSSPYVDKMGGTWAQTMGHAGTGAIASWLSGGDVGQGALNGAAGYLFNRMMSPQENAAVEKLSADGMDRTKAQAVACNETKCWSGSDLGVMSGYTKDQMDAVLQTMSPEEYQSTLAQLKQTAPGQFNYSLIDGFHDGWTDNGIGTRLAGTLQWLGGGIQAGGALASMPLACTTGIACGTAIYLWTSGWDNAFAGAYAMNNGVPAYTWGGQALQHAGLSPGTAELVYGGTQLAPWALEAYAANKAVNVWSATNQYARLSYTTDSFNTLGLQVTTDTLATPVAQTIISQYRAAGASIDEAYRYTANLLSSGSDLPSAIQVSGSTELIKLVPKGAIGGDSVGSYSPFFLTRAQYDQIANLPADKIAGALGLPAEQGVRGSQLGFDVYSMTPKPGQTPTVFSSTVAPVKQGSYSASGGRQQILVPDRSAWTNPNDNKIGEINGGRYGR